MGNTKGEANRNDRSQRKQQLNYVTTPVNKPEWGPETFGSTRANNSLNQEHLRNLNSTKGDQHNRHRSIQNTALQIYVDSSAQP